MPAMPLALTPDSPSELLRHVLSLETLPVTLIICQPRAQFLQALLHDLSSSPQYLNADEEAQEPTVPKKDRDNRHQLLIPTIHQVLTSRNIDVVFVSSLSHLRAYLAVFNQTQKLQSSSSRRADHRKTGGGSLLIHGLLELHRDTGEWSAQGLNHTLSSVVEAGQQNGCDIVLLENMLTREHADGLQEEDQTEKAIRKRRREDAIRVWDEEVPILSGGGGRKAVEGGWSGRKVEIGRIYRRWCRFEKGPWDT